MRQRGFTLIVYAVIALAVLGTLTGIAWKIRESGKDAIRLEWEADKAETRRREAELSAFAAKALADERKKRRIITTERTVYVDRNIEKLVTVDSCIKPAGVSCINAAINGQDASGCKPDGAVPVSKPAG